MDSLFQQIRNVCKQVEDTNNLSKVTTIKFFRHKTNKEDIILNVWEAFERGCKRSDYEEVETISTIKPEIKKAIFGSVDYEINKDEIKYTIDFFSEIIKEIAKKPRKKREAKPEVKDEPKPDAQTEETK